MIPLSLTRLTAALCVLAVFALPAAARLTEIQVTAVEPFAEGASFGDAGAYERVKGTFKGELDPLDPRNKVIVNLDQAPRNAAGRDPRASLEERYGDHAGYVRQVEAAARKLVAEGGGCVINDPRLRNPMEASCRA